MLKNICTVKKPVLPVTRLPDGGRVFFVHFFGKLQCIQCIGHFAYAAHFAFFQICPDSNPESCATKLSTHLPELSHPSSLTQPPITLNQPQYPLISHSSSLTQPPITLNQPSISINQPPTSLYQPHHLPSQPHMRGRQRLPYGEDKEQGTRDKPRTSKRYVQEGTEDASCAGKELVYR